MRQSVNPYEILHGQLEAFGAIEEVCSSWHGEGWVDGEGRGGGRGPLSLFFYVLCTLMLQPTKYWQAGKGKRLKEKPV